MPSRGLRHLLGLATCALLSVAAPRHARAQIVNVLYEAQKLEEGFAGRVNAGGDWLNGNAESVQGEFALGLHYRAGRHLGLAMFNAAYGEANDAPFVDRQLGHLRYRFEIDGPLQVETFLQGDRNPFRRRSLRVVLGGGPRVELLRGPVVRSSLGISYMPDYERLSEGDFVDSGSERWRHRVSFYMSHGIKLGDRANLATTIYLQPALNDAHNVRSFADHSLEIFILNNVSVVLTHSLQVDSEPPDTVHPADASRKLTVTWKF